MIIIEIPEWMTKREITLILKDPLEVTAPTNYRPSTGLLMMWKIPTAKIGEIYHSLINRRIFPDEQKGCRKRTRGTTIYKSTHLQRK